MPKVGSMKRISVRGRKNRFAGTKIDIAVPDFCSTKRKSLHRAESRSKEEKICTGNGSAERPVEISVQGSENLVGSLMRQDLKRSWALDRLWTFS
jgi:hypothetical protein